MDMRVILISALAFLLVACRTTASRYVVTAAPINTGATTQPLCIALDPTDPHGIWWWEPGSSGCRSRSTGPDVFHADEAAIVRSASGAIEGRFRLHLIVAPGSPDVADIAFVVDQDVLRVTASGARVPIERRANLIVPEAPPGPYR